RRSVRVADKRRHRAGYDPRVSIRRMGRRGSALDLFHAAAQGSVDVESSRYMVIRDRDGDESARHRGRRMDVLAVQTISISGWPIEHSVRGTEALAYDPGTGVRAHYIHVDIQRHDVDGSTAVAPGEHARPGGKGLARKSIPAVRLFRETSSRG